MKPLLELPPPFRLLKYLAICLIAVAALAVGVTIWALRGDAIEAAERDSDNIASLLAEQITRSIDGVDAIFHEFSERTAEAAVISPEQFRQAFGTQPVFDIMKERLARLPQADFITVSDSTGHVLNSTRAEVPPGTDFSDRIYFKYLSTHDSDQMLITGTYISRITGMPMIFFGKRINGGFGDFVGIVTIGIGIEYFERSYNSIHTLASQSFVLANRDGTIVVRYPDPTVRRDEKVPPGSDWYDVVAQSGGFYRSPGYFDDEPRIVAVRPLSKYPLVVNVATKESAALATWKRRAILVGFGTLLGMVCSGLLLHALTKRSHDVEKLNLQLDAALNNMSQSLCMFDKNERLLLFNKRYLEIYRLPKDAIKAGCTLTDMLKARAAAGTFAGHPEQFAAERKALVRKGAPNSSTFDLPDGRVIAILNHPMPDGGWVSIHQDVTDQHRAQQALATARAEAEHAAQDARAAHQRLLAAIEVIPEGIVIYDADDRYVLWNRRFSEIYADSGIEFKVGERFEDVLRERLARGQFPEAVGREEEWLKERLARRLKPTTTYERAVAGNRWLLEKDCRTPDGGSIGLRLDITEMKQREASFRLLFDSNPVPMWLHDNETLRFLAVNDAAIEHYGYSREQFLGMTVLDIRPAEDHEDARLAAKSSDDEMRSSRTWTHLKADGSRMDVAVYARSLQYEGRAAKLAALIDVTESKRAEAEIRRTRAFLDTIVENIPVSINVKEARDLRYVLINRAQEEMWGISRADMLGKNAYSFFPPEEAELFAVNDRRALASKKKVVFEAHSLHTRASGLRLVTSTKITIPGLTGEPEFLLTVVDDITERKQAEERLRQAAIVFASTHEAVVIADPRGNIIAVNPAFSTITGYAESELIGKNMRLLRSGRHDGDFYRRMWNSIQTSGFWQGEIWNRRKNGEIYPELLTISTVRNEAGEVVNYIGAFTDISSIKQSEMRLEHLAHHDPLTDLPNRLLLLSRLDEAVTRARHSGGHGAVLLLDLDRFKNVNDSLGHPAGDELLVLVAERLRQSVTEPDIVARMGGDEFIVLLNALPQPDAAGRFAERMIEQFREGFSLAGGREVYIGASIGISLFPDDGEGADDLLQHADAALYRAKDKGRNTFGYYSAVLTHAANLRLQLEADLRRALEHDEFVLHYQPVICLADGRICGVEALVRWQHPALGLVQPGDFISVAEDTGLIIPLGDWVLRAGCRQMKAWIDAGLPIETMAINLSSRQFERSGLDQRIKAILQETGLPAHRLELELTESALMKQGSEASQKLNALKDLGVRLAIDDFGTGYSSLAYLARLPIDKLKIDQSFVHNIPHDRASTEITATVIALAKNLSIQVVAEGVEEQAQLEFVRNRGCDSAQGYLFSPPLPGPDILNLVGAFSTAGLPGRKSVA